MLMSLIAKQKYLPKEARMVTIVTIQNHLKIEKIDVFYEANK
jgi:hypothetical protein